jgi:hypothetical protein
MYSIKMARRSAAHPILSLSLAKDF